MCELFGACSKRGIELNEYLKVFYGRSEHHPHGWGLGILHENDALIEKEPIQASKSNYLKERLKHPIVETALFAHIRYATIGNIEYRNCHPYTRVDENGRRWTLIHNGTIFEYEPLDKYAHVQAGDTDSERILYHIVDEINQEEKAANRRLNAQERFAVVDRIMVALSKGNKVNLLLYDNEQMYVHTNYAQSLYLLEKDDTVLFATAPLSHEDWKPVPFTRLLAYQEGRLAFTGTEHGNEYIENEENLKFLYQIFSDL
jgi:glutamine amidotransferase